MSILVQTDRLGKTFGTIPAVHNVSFDAAAGEIFGLLGPNGAGKTTTIRMIATVLAPTSGTAAVAGYDIRSRAQEVRRHIGVLTTEIGVYERFSGSENLRYFGELYGLPRSRIDERINTLSRLLEMEEFLDKRAGTYSTGMKQKLAIARSVVHDPDVIIFDEPTAGLDVLASRTVLAFMRQARELGKCVILSTHEMTDAEKLCDRVGVIHRGRLIAVERPKALMHQTGTRDLEEAFVALLQQKHLEVQPA